MRRAIARARLCTRLKYQRREKKKHDLFDQKNLKVCGRLHV